MTIKSFTLIVLGLLFAVPAFVAMFGLFASTQAALLEGARLEAEITGLLGGEVAPDEVDRIGTTAASFRTVVSFLFYGVADAVSDDFAGGLGAAVFQGILARFSVGLVFLFLGLAGIKEKRPAPRRPHPKPTPPSASDLVDDESWQGSEFDSLRRWRASRRGDKKKP